MIDSSDMVCIVCGGAKAAGLSPWHARCPACAYESGALEPAINDRHEHERLNEQDRETGLKALRLENFKAIVQYARRFAPATDPATHPSASGAHRRPRLLDVGSAHGWFLQAACGSFDVLGVEPDSAVGERAAASGLPVRAGYFPDALAADERFDVIVFNDVIEHIPDVRGALAACRERLGPGGILVLNLPSSAGFFYRLSKILAGAGWRAPFERLWQKGLPSPHVHYFDSRNLAALVGRHGFEPVHRAQLPALRARGLLERLRCAGDTGKAALYFQYAAILCAIPLLRAFPSDIIVCVFRKKAAGP